MQTSIPYPESQTWLSQFWELRTSQTLRLSKLCGQFELLYRDTANFPSRRVANGIVLVRAVCMSQFVQQVVRMVSMSNQFQGDEMPPHELELAYSHWEALMFAPSRAALEKAQLALLEAPPSVRQAVIHSINDFWLRDYEPSRDDNPFK